MKRKKPLLSVEWDGLCGHPSGLRTPEQMVKIARAKIHAMEGHSGLEWLRKEDKEAMSVPPGGKRYGRR